MRDSLVLQSTDQENVEAKVILRGDENEVVENARLRLLDFVIPYSILSLQAPTISESWGASVIEGWEGKGYTPAKAGLFYTVTLSVTKERMEEAQRIAQVILEVLQTSEPRQIAFLRNAIRFALAASQALRSEDKLINLFISIEALYSLETLEVSYRLSHRVSSLLADSEDERTRIFDRVRELYDKRSRIVHGNMETVSGEEIAELTRYVNQSLLPFCCLIQLHSTKKKIIRLLDESVLNSEARDRIRKDAQIDLSRDPLL